jgi:hypothetical protein
VRWGLVGEEDKEEEEVVVVMSVELVEGERGGEKGKWRVYSCGGAGDV